MVAPKFSLKCITHGRVHLLQEALHSFLIQENSEDTELVIVNDYPYQSLIFDHPRVKIFNFDSIFKTIGDKENFAIEQCSGDTIVVFDDDDIALSHHINNIKKYWKEDSNLLHWHNAVYYNEPEITSLMGVGNSGIVYSKKAWEAIGKSPIMNAGGDMQLITDIRKLDEDKVVYAHPPNEEVSWFYRWRLPQNYHQSGQGTDDGTRPDIIRRNHDYVESQRKMGLIQTGDIHLKPAWRFPYDKMLKNFLKQRKNQDNVS